MTLILFSRYDSILTVMKTMKSKLKSNIAILVATIIWGSTFVAQSIGMDHIGPFTFQTARCCLGGLILLPIIAVSDQFTCKDDGKNFLSRWLDKRLWKAGLFCGIPLFAATNLQQVALVDTDAGKSAFLTAMYIVFVPIIGMFFGQKPSKWIPFSVILGVAGLYCLSCVGVTTIATGDLLLLGCAVAFAIQILAVDKYANQVDCLRLNCINAFLCAILSAIVMLLTETPKWSAIEGCFGSIAYAGILSMGIAYSLQNIGQKNLDSATASLLMSTESVFAVLSGWIVLKQGLDFWEGLGCALVFAAIILSQLPDKKKAKSTT